MAGKALVQNRLYYVPFLLTGTICAALFYILRFLQYNPMIEEMLYAPYIMSSLFLGTGIMAFLTCWILSYANNFVMRRRRHELALYNILGMEKIHIARILAWETIFLAVGAILLGVALGTLFSKLVLLLLLKILKTAVQPGFDFCLPGAQETALWFLVLYFALYLRNLWAVQRVSPIELLHSNTTGEREPKSRGLMAVAGVLILGAGYALSAFTTNVAAVIYLFFVAVGLVILGTHLLFGAGSVTLLKALRRNKSFYYKPRPFIAVSGLLYRMNQNARGLANICILSTTVLVSVATTVGLYMGIEDSVLRYCPYLFSLYTATTEEQDLEDFAGLAAAVQEAAAPYGIKAEAFPQYLSLETAVGGDPENGFTKWDNQMAIEISYVLNCFTAEGYAAQTGRTLNLAPGEVYLSGAPETLTKLKAGGREWNVAGHLTSFPTVAEYNGIVAHTWGVVVADTAELRDLAAATGGEKIYFRMWCDPAGMDNEEQLALTHDMNAAQRAYREHQPESGPVQGYVYTTSRATMRQQNVGLFGSFVFLGAFLGIIFTLATSLIIYYKQLSEGYEDRNRFVIMQQVGLSAQEVRSAIHTQIILVFFLPLGMAAVHLVAAFPMLRRIVAVLGVTNAAMFAGCAAVTFAIFAVFYIAFYAVTSRRYYRIVRM